MAGETGRFRLTTFDSPNDMLDYRGFKFGRADRELIDRILTYAAEGHRHTGESTAPVTPTSPAPTFTVSTSGGSIPANRAVYYRTALVDSRGQEHAGSLTATATTGPWVPPPSPFLVGAGSGVLTPGIYVYALSAYTLNSHNETPLSYPATGRLDVIGGFSIFLPPLPSGATGFNLYRKGPTDLELYWVKNFTPPVGNTFVDTGIELDPLRTVPTTNTTNGTNSITISQPGGIPTGHTLKIYRTYDQANWDRSLLVWTAVEPYVDEGHATQIGAPLAASAAVLSPPKITMPTETEGRPPPGLVPTVSTVTFAFPGYVTTGNAAWQWISDYDHARVLSLRATLGRGSAPSSRPVRVALEWRTANTNAWHRYQINGINDIITDIPVGQQAGPYTPISTYTTPGNHLLPGWAIRPVILQNGSGATPTDYDLTVTVTLAVRHGSDTETYPWET